MLLYSFVIPVYNVEEYLNQCVDSILHQTYQTLEVLLVDDGSTDSSLQICHALAEKDSRVRVLHKENGGLSSARNHGLRYASGDYVIYLDSDDWWSDHEGLERINQQIERTGADVILFSSKKYFQRDKVFSVGSAIHESMSDQGCLTPEVMMRNALFLACAWDKVIRRRALQDNDIWFVEGQLSEDVEWCSKLLLQDLKYAAVGGVIHVYRQQNSKSITSNLTNRNLHDIKEVLVKYNLVSSLKYNQPLRHFLALEYVLWLAITNHAKEKKGKDMIRQMKVLYPLVQNNWYPRVATLSKVSLLGYSLVRWLLIFVLRSKSLFKRRAAVSYG